MWTTKRKEKHFFGWMSRIFLKKGKKNGKYCFSVDSKPFVELLKFLRFRSESKIEACDGRVVGAVEVQNGL